MNQYLREAPTSLDHLSLPIKTSLYGFEVNIYREGNLFFIESTEWGSVLGSGKSYPEAKEDFLETLRDSYTIYSKNADSDLSKGAQLLKRALIENKNHYLNAS